jgi:DNA-binding transcriptional LysR family regulator
MGSRIRAMRGPGGVRQAGRIMELRQLRYFVAVAEDLHFRRAAARLHIAQPAVSEQIRKLESELGVRLLERSTRGVRLTGAGTVFLEDARRILRCAEAARHAARKAGDDARVRLRLGHTALGLPAVVPHTLARLRTAAAPVHLELRLGDARGLLADVRTGFLDAAVVHLPAPTAGLRTTELAVDEGIAVVAGDDGRRGRPHDVADIARGPVRLMARAVDPAFHDAVVAAFVGRELVADVEESSAPTLDQLLLEIAAGAGTGIISAEAFGGAVMAGVGLRPLTPGTLACPVAVVTRDETPNATLATLLDELRVAVQRPRRATLAAI